MKVYDGADIRNIAVVGHGDSGKTSLASCLLYTAGAVNRIGSVDDGTTVTDFDDEEISRKISLSGAACFLEWKKKKFNIIDTPGYANFIADAKAALSVVDGALCTVHAVSGVQVMTERVWKYAEDYSLPFIFVISVLDRERASFERSVASIQEMFERAAVPLHLPIGSEHEFKGVIDLVSQKAWESGGDPTAKPKEGGVPDDLKDAVAEARAKLVEAVAETDDALMEKFFDKGELAQEELESGLRAAILARKIFPILCASGTYNIGSVPILDAVNAYFPSPVERGPRKGINPESKEELTFEPKDIAPKSAFVFKTFADPYAGRITLFRVFSGTVGPDTTLYNPIRESNERLGAVHVMQGKHAEIVSEMKAGDIGAVMKLKDTHTGDTLCEKDHQIQYPDIEFPVPVISYAIEPRSQGDDDKISTALARLCEEDPVLKVGREEQTGEMLISGMGLEHVRVAIEKMAKKFGVHADIKSPKVPYRETIRVKAEGMYRHKKQTGGAGQFAEVHMKIEPQESGAGFEFASEIFGGSISRNFWPSIEKGIKSVMTEGVIAGYPVVDVKATITDGKQHTVDSKDIAFQIAGRYAFRECIQKAKPVLLEPIMKAEITIPEECMGDVIGDMTSRRGRVEGMETAGHSQLIRVFVPLAEMLEYAATLKAVTSDRGSFTMELERYDEVPAMIQEKIVEAHKAAGKPDAGES